MKFQRIRRQRIRWWVKGRCVHEKWREGWRPRRGKAWRLGGRMQIGKWGGLRKLRRRRIQRKRQWGEQWWECRNRSFSIWVRRNTMVLSGKQMGFSGRERRRIGGDGYLRGWGTGKLRNGLLVMPWSPFFCILCSVFFVFCVFCFLFCVFFGFSVFSVFFSVCFAVRYAITLIKHKGGVCLTNLFLFYFFIFF